MPKKAILASKCNYARGSLIALLVNRFWFKKLLHFFSS